MPKDSAIDDAFARRGCCFCWGRHPGAPEENDGDNDRPSSATAWWERVGESSDEKPWWMQSYKRLRGWSELAAGPRWKTFIRRFSRNRNGKGEKFQYDPLSYTLNFYEGKVQDGHFDEDSLWRDFSSRYASIPLSCKSSMDLGKSGGPVFD